jgi:uncharacterized protein YdeI (BOF family)
MDATGLGPQAHGTAARQADCAELDCVTGASWLRGRLLRTAGSALAAGTLMVGLGSCALSIGGLQHRTISYTIGGRVTTLVVADQAGDVTVTGGDSGAISVTEHISFRGTAPATTHSTTAGTLNLDSNCPATETCTVGYVITAPRTTTVRVTDEAGDVALASLSGTVTTHVSAGRISLSSLVGPVNVAGNAGSIRGQNISSAKASVLVSAGSIDLGFSAPPTAVTAATDVGAITIRVPDSVGYKVTTSAIVGTVDVGVARSASATRTITATTKTGSITIEPSA